MKNPGKRAHPRKDVQIPAVVSDRDFEQSFNCMVCDASRSGCRFKSDRLSEIPDEIYVQAAGMSQPIKGRIVWRKITMAGVEFIWNKPVVTDERAEDKSEQVLSAVISDRQGQHPITCAVHSLNVSGCMAVADGLDILPEDVSIKLESIDAPFNARIAWHNDNIAGVEFEWKAGNNRKDTAQTSGPRDDNDVLELSTDQELSSPQGSAPAVAWSDSS